MEEQPNNSVATVASGMFISRINSDDDRRTSYELNKVTDIEGFVADTWGLVEDLGGVQIQKGKNGPILTIEPKVGGILRVSASNEEYAKKMGIEATEVILTTKIFSFFFKVKEYKELSKGINFSTNIGRSMLISAGDFPKILIPGIDLPIKKRFNE